MISCFERAPLSGDEFSLLNQLSQLLDLFSEEGAFPDGNFKPVKLGRIMASCHHHSTLLIQMEQGEIIDRSRTEPDIDDIASC